MSEETLPLIVQSSLTVRQTPAHPAALITLPVTVMLLEHHRPTPWS